MKVGVNGRNDFWKRTFTDHDYQAIRGAKIELVKMLSYTDLDVYRRLREENPAIDFIVRLYEEGGDHGTPEEFVDRHALRIDELRPFTHKFEILNEPNRSDEGWGPTLEDAGAFNDWYVKVVDLLRARFPWIEPGFPGLSPTMLPDDPHDDLEWVKECGEAVQASAWLGCHCYWFDEHAILHPVFGLRFTHYHSLFPDKPIHVTEFNGPMTGTPTWHMSEYYRRYYIKVADYPYVKSASAFILSSPDSTFHSLAWWEPGSGEMRPVVWSIGGIPRPLGAPPDRPIYAVEYLSHDTPTTMVAGQVNAVRLEVRNPGSKTWQADGYNQVRLGYHWHYTEGGQIPSALWADLRTTLPHDLRPDETVELVAEVAAPRVAGNYVLKWDMVEEMITWFAWQSVPTLDVAVEVNPSAPPPPAPEMKVTASHNNSLYGPDNLQQALDGNPYTRWSTLQAQRPDMWFQIDLGEVKEVAHVRLDNEASPRDYPRGYILELSIDGQSWGTVAARPNNDRELDVSFPPHQARYIRIQQTGSDSFYWWSIHRIAISDEPAMGAAASHNNRRLGPDNLTQAFDGHPETRWSTMTVQAPGMWFELDLGQIQMIRGFRFDNTPSPDDYPRGYRVKVSTDKAHWTEVAANPDNDAPLDVTFAPREVRYIHVEQTGRSGYWWWSIHEIEIKT
jgi:hypothetical protein